MTSFDPLHPGQGLARIPPAPRGIGLCLLVMASALRAAPVTGAAPPSVPQPLTAPVSTPKALRKPVGCMISPDRVADVGTPAAGVVQAFKVQLGDRVRAGQALVLLRSDVESANVQVAAARSSLDAEVRAAQAEVALANQRLARSQALQAQGFVSAQATEQARAEQQVAEQKLLQAQGQRRVSASELGLARAQYGQRQVLAPFDGVITDRFLNEGERVEEKPLLRLARLDPLRVELVVPAALYGRVAMHQKLPVAPELPGAPLVTAQVVHVDPLIDAASNTYRVRLRLPNPGGQLPGGARCRVDLPEVGAEVAAAPATNRAATPAASPAATPAATRAAAVATPRPPLALKLSL